MKRNPTIDSSPDDQKIMNDHAELISQIASHYSGFGVPTPKLVERGYQELIQSARRFDTKQGFSFKVFACWSIKRALAQMVAK